jgi:hypothetical protein
MRRTNLREEKCLCLLNYFVIFAEIEIHEHFYVYCVCTSKAWLEGFQLSKNYIYVTVKIAVPHPLEVLGTAFVHHFHSPVQ